MRAGRPALPVTVGSVHGAASLTVCRYGVAIGCQTLGG